MKAGKKQKLEAKRHFLEINKLLASFGLIKSVLKHANDAYKERNPAVALLHYAKILSIYQQIGNKKGQGVIHNNIGNIHLRSDRIDEALKGYEQAVQCNAIIF